MVGRATVLLAMAALFSASVLAITIPGDFDSDGDVNLDEYAMFAACYPVVGGECGVDADLSRDGLVDLRDFALFQAAFNGEHEHPALPNTYVGYDLIGVHDPQSDSYDADCVSCHGTMVGEKALDGLTTTAHGRMLLFFAAGNERCVECHTTRTDILTGSTANLRKQVDLEATECAVCHDSVSELVWYVR